LRQNGQGERERLAFCIGEPPPKMEHWQADDLARLWIKAKVDFILNLLGDRRAWLTKANV